MWHIPIHFYLIIYTFLSYEKFNKYFNRLAQRVTAGLSVPTAAGVLYEVDTRLRPSGEQGPLVVTLDSFERYQREEAWTWEHMALTRARLVFGSPQARVATQTIIDDVLNRPHDPQKLVADAAKMRSDIAEHKPPKGPLDVKLCEGGLVDLEFAVHVLQLMHGMGLDPHLGSAIEGLVDAGWLRPEMSNAYQLLTRLLVTVRLVAPDLQAPSDPVCALIARGCDQADWPSLLAALDSVRQGVSNVWQEISTAHPGD